MKSGGQALNLHEDYFPLDFSAQKDFSAGGSPSLRESGSAWFFNVNDLTEKNKNNPHFDLYEGLLEEARGAIFTKTKPIIYGDFDLISYGADGKEGGEGKDADIKSRDIQ